MERWVYDRQGELVEHRHFEEVGARELACALTKPPVPRASGPLPVPSEIGIDPPRRSERLAHIERLARCVCLCQVFGLFLLIFETAGPWSLDSVAFTAHQWEVIFRGIGLLGPVILVNQLLAAALVGLSWNEHRRLACLLSFSVFLCIPACLIMAFSTSQWLRTAPMVLPLYGFLIACVVLDK